MSYLPAWLPLSEGYLPIALTVVLVLSIFNTVQCFTSTYYNSRIYNRSHTGNAIKGRLAQSEVTNLSCRTFGIWTALTGFIRLYAACHLDDVHCYRICLATYVCAWLHFASEIVIFKTADLNGVVKAPAVVATTMSVWMWLAWDSYVQ